MRPEKKAIVDEISKELKVAAFIVLADYRGLTVEQFSDLRGRLRLAGAGVLVVKNAFLGRAWESLGHNGIRSLLGGPTAMISGSGDVTRAARTLRNFVSENDLPVIKGGWLPDRLLSPGEIEEIAMIPAREVMLGRLVGTVYAPMPQLVRVLNQKVLSLLYVLKAIERTRGDT